MKSDVSATFTHDLTDEHTGEKRILRSVRNNRILYSIIVLAVLISAFLYGERMMYVSLVVLIVLPVLSYVFTHVLLRNLSITQDVPTTIIKGAQDSLCVNVNNHSPMLFGNIECLFLGDGFAVEAPEALNIRVRPFRSTVHAVKFKINYRGEYQLGLGTVQTMDLMGLFSLKHKFNKKVSVIVLPRVLDLTDFPLAANLMTEANSRFDIRDEDYATISDIRPYMPTDSIKRVHWKLTAKRNEWIVKIFQSNALNRVSIILDSAKLPVEYKEGVALEDRMVEISLGLARFCLMRGMPVDFMVGKGHKSSGQGPGDFQTIYNAIGGLLFETTPRLDPLAILNQCLNDASGYLNAVILTGRLDSNLYERLLNAAANGHYIAVLYFAAAVPDLDSEKTYQLLTKGSSPCWKISDGNFVE